MSGRTAARPITGFAVRANPARRDTRLRVTRPVQGWRAASVHGGMPWFVETTSPLWFVVLLAASGVAGTVAVLLVVETARDRS